MKRHIMVVVLITMGFIGLFASESRAVGLGFYLEGGQGSGESTIESWSYPYYEYDTDFDASYLGIGFVLDTAPSGNSVFNYRLSIGYESLSYEPVRGSNADLNGLSVANDFGFAVLKSDRQRLWIGPEIKIAYYTGDADDGADISCYSFGIGPVIGMNFVLANGTALTIKGGYLYRSFIGEGEYPTGRGYDVSGNAGVAFIGVGMLFGR